MTWQIKLEKRAEKELSKLDRYSSRKIRQYLRYEIGEKGNPRERGKALTGNKKGLWRYRVGKYRIICKIQDEVLTVLALTIAKRDVVYDD